MIKLKRIELQAFRCFKSYQSIDFPDSGLFLISGKNLDTGGSSNSGKTSFNLAIAYALGFCPFPATTLQNWFTDQKMYVRLYLTVDDKNVEISRGANTYIVVDGKKISGAKAVEEKINEVLGLPTEFLQMLCFREQQKPGRFLSMSDSDKKEFLSQLLSLEELEKLVEDSKNKVVILGTALQEAKFRAEAADKQLRLIDPTPLPLTNSDEYEKKIGILKEEKQKINNSIYDLILDKDKLKEEFEARKEAAAIEHKKKLYQIEKKVADFKLQNKSSEEKELEDTIKRLVEEKEVLFNKVNADRNKILEELNNNKAEAQRLKLKYNTISKYYFELEKTKKHLEITQSNKCPTCKQSWLENSSFVEELLNKQRDLTFELTCLVDLEPKIKEKEAQIKTLQLEHDRLGGAWYSQFDDLDSKIRQHTEQLKELELKRLSGLSDLEMEKKGLSYDWFKTLTALESDFSYNSRINHIENLIQENKEAIQFLDSEINSWAMKIHEIKNKNEFIQKENSLRAKLYQSSLEQKKRFDEEFNKINIEIAKEEDFISLIGREGFLGSIFDEVLEEISHETSEILKSIPNVSRVTVRFKSESQTQKATVKRSIIPVVMKSGLEIPLSAGLSGGMMTAVELAIDLAVANVISRRTGKMPGWLVLDESFEGLGIIEKEACSEILKRNSSNRLILVVDHSTEFKEMFDGFIEIESADEVSRLVAS